MGGQFSGGQFTWGVYFRGVIFRRALFPGAIFPGAFFLFVEIQLTQISFDFKTSCCNLKIRGLGAKLCVAFPLSLFWKQLRHFKVKESMLFVEQQYKLKNGYI